MAELSDIVTLTVISSTRANLWQSRLVQRYSSVANRTSEHPSPAEGDLSYLEDANVLDVYTGAAWVPFIATNEADGYVEVATVALSGTFAARATINLAIPAGWGSWKCFASATAMLSGAGTVVIGTRIDGSAQQSLVYTIPAAGQSPIAAVGRRTGMSTTGSRAIELMASSTGAANLVDINFYARAVRTS